MKKYGRTIPIAILGIIIVLVILSFSPFFSKNVALSSSSTNDSVPNVVTADPINTPAPIPVLRENKIDTSMQVEDTPRGRYRPIFDWYSKPTATAVPANSQPNTDIEPVDTTGPEVIAITPTTTPYVTAITPVYTIKPEVTSTPIHSPPSSILPFDGFFGLLPFIINLTSPTNFIRSLNV